MSKVLDSIWFAVLFAAALVALGAVLAVHAPDPGMGAITLAVSGCGAVIHLATTVRRRRDRGRS